MDIQIDRDELQRIQEQHRSNTIHYEVMDAEFIEFDVEVLEEPEKPKETRPRGKPAPVTSVLRYNVPWMDRQRRYSTHPTERLHQEIVDFANYVSPTEEERYSRSEAVRRLTEVVQSLWREATVQVFGSFDSQLYLPSSDLDVVVVHQDLQLDDYTKPPLKKLAKALLKAGIPIPETVKVITKARVPIIKYVDHNTDFEIDVSFNVTSGLEAATFMQKQMKAQSAIRPFTLVMKHFLHMRELNEVFHGGLGSFSIMCLVISFLQMHPLVQTGLIRAHENLGVLVLEFFELYGRNFNSDIVGISVQKDGSYYDKEERGWLQEAKPHLLSIEDPQTEENDISKGSFAYGAVRHCFEHAFNVLRCAMQEFEVLQRRQADKGKNDPQPMPSLLGSIITLDPKLLRHRYYIQQTANI
ncbi:Poly(A) RNA polymerase cid14 [Paramicrosporidium saccamoebae]|uniref:polynucleotide adenylyltransferase n=1 Tax=Paramicrosporidium saccamoebae TaxID=1246581 RepID=A0A2H9TIJ3_9FUNG|nr:Poly(A) RNA polymerase cid14 [Paramicrosporidium saccamoebae]